ncbi:hypothetical protein SAMN02745221_02086 [Thermosyntropha lipolytica DSM 11003]|uniref:Zinc metallopeptidase n=2 Tax=Thermosyntropha TaxID=54293 RepID=A0A1M5RQR3_9FIRM|nr:hypothetical protein SAMN02745221_02086 [Thermosyntropha lipolytica DSM 11003]
MAYLIFILPAFILSIYAQFKVKSTFEKYSRVRSMRGMTGAEVAAQLLRRKGLTDVGIDPVGGSLTDHYDPRVKRVRLSEPVYGSNSLAAIGVAAHEVGHAIQHGEKYGPLELRHAIVPVTNFASGASFPILLVGIILNSANLVLIGILLFSAVVLFHLVTLPVEFNASRRAVMELESAGIITPQETPAVKKVLSAAALTYLAAAISAIANLLYYVMIFLGSRED